MEFYSQKFKFLTVKISDFVKNTEKLSKVKLTKSYSTNHMLQKTLFSLLSSAHFSTALSSPFVCAVPTFFFQNVMPHLEEMLLLL